MSRQGCNNAASNGADRPRRRVACLAVAAVQLLVDGVAGVPLGEDLGQAAE